jgi:hypothetical protein
MGVPMLRAPCVARPKPLAGTVMRVPCRSLVVALAVQLTLVAPVLAQSRTFTACTPDALAVCTEVRLTATPSVFEIALRTVGATGSPSTPVSVYNLIFGTGAVAAMTPVDHAVAPVGAGGATVNDGSAWDLFDSGDALFLSATTNRGVGGCVAGADIAGFGQAVTTCGIGQYATFTFVPTTNFNPTLFTVLDLEAVGLTDALPGASCGGELACVMREGTTPVSTVPEPSSVVLLGGALVALAVGRQRRRTAAGSAR